MTSKHKNSVIIDTGILVEYYQPKSKERQEHIEYLERKLFKNPTYDNIVLTFIARTELLYILCRLYDWNTSKDKVDRLLENFIVVRDQILDEIAASLKCALSISLPDCYVIAAGIYYGLPVFFAEEQEITEEIQVKIRNEFNVDMHIIRKYR